MIDGSILEAFIALWEQVGVLTKVGLISQAAAVGLVGAAVCRPSRPLLVAALFACILGLLGLSLTGLGTLEYVACGSSEPPAWCGR